MPIISETSPITGDSCSLHVSTVHVCVFSDRTVRIWKTVDDVWKKLVPSHYRLWLVSTSESTTNILFCTYDKFFLHLCETHVEPEILFGDLGHT